MKNFLRTLMKTILSNRIVPDTIFFNKLLNTKKYMRLGGNLYHILERTMYKTCESTMYKVIKRTISVKL